LACHRTRYSDPTHRFTCRSEPRRHVNPYELRTSVYMSYDMALPSQPTLSPNTYRPFHPTHRFTCRSKPERHVNLRKPTSVYMSVDILLMSPTTPATSVYMSYDVEQTPSSYRLTTRPHRLTCRTYAIYMSVDILYIS